MKRQGELDAFFTYERDARALVHAYLDRYTPSEDIHLLEPSAGGGAWVRVLAQEGLRPYAVDIQECEGIRIRPERSHQQNFLDPLPAAWPSAWDLIIGNPPFNQAEAHVQRALELTQAARGGMGRVAFLLLLQFLQAKERRWLWEGNYLEHIFIPEWRLSFLGGKHKPGRTDMRPYGLFVFSHLHHHLDLPPCTFTGEILCRGSYHERRGSPHPPGGREALQQVR